MPDVRVCFTKTGDLRYISHLDLQRAMARLLIRSGLPIAFTEGFNPHPKLNIALPLSVYQEGENEIFDFRLTDDVPLDEVKAKLNAVMFPGSVVRSAEILTGKSSAKSAVYRLELETDLTPDDFRKALEAGMTVVKRSKSGEKTVDIAPMIKLLSAEPTEKGLTLRAELPASGGDYLNPSYIVGYFGARVVSSRIVREKIVF